MQVCQRTGCMFLEPLFHKDTFLLTLLLLLWLSVVCHTEFSYDYYSFPLS